MTPDARRGARKPTRVSQAETRRSELSPIKSEAESFFWAPIDGWPQRVKELRSRGVIVTHIWLNESYRGRVDTGDLIPHFGKGPLGWEAWLGVTSPWSENELKLPPDVRKDHDEVASSYSIPVPVSVVRGKGRPAITTPCPHCEGKGRISFEALGFWPGWAIGKSPPYWQALSTYIRWRDGRTCQRCGAEGATQVHHIVAKEDGGSDNPRNLHILCGDCHTEAHDNPRQMPLEAPSA